MYENDAFGITLPPSLGRHRRRYWLPPQATKMGATYIHMTDYHNLYYKSQGWGKGDPGPFNSWNRITLLKKAQSMFAPVGLVSWVLQAPHTWLCPFFSVVHEVTHEVRFIVSPSTIWQNVRNFGPIFEQNANFGRIFEKSVNFEHFINGRWTHYNYQRCSMHW